MVQPINYMAQIPQPDLGRSLLSGLQLGSGIRDIQQQRAAAEQAQAAKQQLAADVAAARADGSQQAWLGMIAKYPQFREAFAEVRKGVGEEQVKSEFFSGFEISNALEANQPLVAAERLRTEIAARKNSGKPAGLYEQALARIEAGDNQRAQSGINEILSALDPERFEKTVKAKTTAALAPAELRQKLAVADKAESDAKIALATAKNANEVAKAEADLKRAQADKEKVDAEFARSNTLLEQEKKRADIKKTEADILIAKEDNRIKALNATIARETNVLRRQELQQKIDDATEKRDSTKREQQAILATAQADVDNFVNTATQVLNTPIEIIQQATGPVVSRLPTLSQPVADFESLVETLGSQIFIAQIPKIKGAGALSEKEGDKLQASVQNLSLKQSPDQLKANVREAVRLLEKARTNLAQRAGLPSTPRDVPAEGLTVRLPNGATATFPTKDAADAYKKAAGIK